MARRRPPKPATAVYLERVALWYLERYPGSTARVRRTLEKRVRRSVEELGTDPAEGAAAVDEVLAKLRRLGMLDDVRFAASRVRVMRERGKSARAIRAALARQGVDASTVDQALGEGGDDLDAARLFARKRRLGPWRREGVEVDPQRELGKLARAGFSFDVARRILDGDGE